MEKEPPPEEANKTDNPSAAESENSPSKFDQEKYDKYLEPIGRVLPPVCIAAAFFFAACLFDAYECRQERTCPPTPPNGHVLIRYP